MACPCRTYDSVSRHHEDSCLDGAQHRNTVGLQRGEAQVTGKRVKGLAWGS